MVYDVLCPILGGNMNNKVIKTIDEHNIDRDAYIMFAFDLEGSEYVSYRISRDEEQDNLFISKIIKDTDGTFKMLDVESSDEKARLNSIVMALVEGAVKNSADKLNRDSVTLSDGNIVKFIDVKFNKEQSIKVKKTYITTVKKEVSRVTEKYYDVVAILDQTKVEEVFPAVTPVTPVVEEVKVVEPVPTVVESITVPIVEAPTSVSVVSQPVETVATVVQPTPVVETPIVQAEVVTPVQPVVMSAPVVEPVPTVVASIPTVDASTNVIGQTVQPVPSVVEPVTVATTPVVQAVPVQQVVVEPTVVAPTPVSANVAVTESQPLVFDASKETNLNAALGEVANTATIPVENIQPVREFGVDAPVQQSVAQQTVVTPMIQPEVAVASKKLTKKAGYANSKFFMVVAIAFFLASCIFLGYEVFNYFQLTK